jgi:YbgC/YbaW family acyl-CoA thioester hydrolase
MRSRRDLRPVTTSTEPAVPSICTEVQVMFYDTDCAGVVHNVAYLRFVEVARTLLATELGMDLAEMAARGLYPVVARTEIDYKRPAKVMDKLEIHGQMEGFDRMRLWFSFEVRRPSDQTLLAKSRQMLALVQVPQGKPLPWPEEWTARYPHLRRQRGNSSSGT